MIIPKDIFYNNLSCSVAMKSTESYPLKTYCGICPALIGQANVNVSYYNQNFILPLAVAD